MELIWDDFGSHKYEVGIDRGVFYPKNGIGVPWNGLVSVSELEGDTSSGKIIFVDGQRRATELGIGTFAAILSAVTYPDEFEKYDGYDDMGASNQRRKSFDLSYRSYLSNEIDDRRGYLIHLVYNALATPTTHENYSVNESVNPLVFSWGISTTPVVIPDARATSHFVIDSTKAYPETLIWLEEQLYGTSLINPHMPSALEVLALFEEHAIFKVIPHGDGTVTISGPDTAVNEISPNLWHIDWPSVTQVGIHTYHMQSL